MDVRYQSRLNRAKKLVAQNRFAPAQKLYEDILKEDPEQPDALVGICLLDERRAKFRAGELHTAPPKPKPSAPPPTATPVVTSPVSSEPIVTAATAESGDLGNLRCNRCGDLLSIKTAVSTPVGYRCKNCIRTLEDEKYYSATIVDNLLAGVTSLLLGGILAFLMSLLDNFFIIFLGTGIGLFIGSTISRLVKRRRGRYLPIIVATGIFLSCLCVFFFITTPSFFVLFAAGMAMVSAYYRLRG